MADSDIMDIVTMLRAPDRLEPCMCAAAADEIERLRADRDEARREVCEISAEFADMYPKDFAMNRGWDCFKENTND